MTQPDWDDERLDAAFHAQFDHPAPTSLANDVHVRIAGTSPTRFGGLRVGRTRSLAAAAVVVVLVTGTALVGLGGLGRIGGSPLLGASSGGPGPSATPTEQAVPGVVFGLPIIRVTDALRVRDAIRDDRELAVLGWFTPAPPVSCGPGPSVEPVVPLQVRCGDDLVWLTEDAESLVHVRGVDRTVEAPKGPGLNPDLDTLDTGWFPTLPVPGIDGDSAPVDVVLVGHFDDRRAELCPRDEIDACRDRFVVDSVALVHGVPQPVSKVHHGRGAVSDNEEIEAVVANEAPDSPILSLTVVDGATGLAAAEPSLGTGQANLIDQPFLWIVRVLESERLVTYVVIDGSDVIYEMNPDGEAILVGGEAAQPSRPTASSSAWPPAGARVVDLTSEVGAGAPPVQVAVVDHSGRLGGIAEKGTVDPSTRTLDRRIEAYPELGVSPGRVHLVWVGSICDSRITVTVAQDLGTIYFDMGPLVDCDSIGIGRELVLDFSGLLNVPAIELVDATGTPPSSVDPTGYALDCGLIEHGACLARAADIVAATPDKRMVSLTLLDECGSHSAIFDDGTGVTATSDCVRPPAPS